VRNGVRSTMVLLAIAETSLSTRSPAVKSHLYSLVTDVWGPLTCGVPPSVSLSPLCDLGFVLFLQKSYLLFP